MRVTLTSYSPTTHEAYTTEIIAVADPDTGLCDVSILDAEGVAVEHRHRLDRGLTLGLVSTAAYVHLAETRLPQARDTWLDGHEMGVHAWTPRHECPHCQDLKTLDERAP